MNLLSKSLLTLLLAIAVCLSGCEDDDPSSAAENIDVSLSNLSTLGDVLVDENGMTLYFFTKDTDGSSACNGGCLDAWPVFYRADINVASTLTAADFGVITRGDGSKQTTYKGWPLYYFGGDVAENDVTGEGVGGVWFVAKPDYTLMLANQEIDGSEADYFVDSEGNALYFFANDDDNVSNCSDGCLTAWPVFSGANNTIVPSILSNADFGQIDSNDGAKQMTYKGQPMYYFAQDQDRGDVNGRAVASWSLSNF